jgi:hypothetical protein
MAVVKLSKSGKQLQFIDEEGNMFVTSAAFVMGLMQGRSKYGFLLLSRLPLKVAKDRFKESPLYDPSGLAQANESHGDNDALSQKSLKAQKQVNTYKDKVVW